MSIDQGPEPSRRASRIAADGGHEIVVTNERDAAEAVAEVLAHRRAGAGKLIGLAGLPRHGKTEFAKQVRDSRKAGPEEIKDYQDAKTIGGMVNIYYLPGADRRDVLIDLAGEDFQEFGRYSTGVPDVMKRLLWPVLPELDGVIVFIALPLLWEAWNRGAETPSSADIRTTEGITAEMIDSTNLLLKYLKVAQNLPRVRARNRTLELVPPPDRKASWAPSRRTIDDAFPTARPLEIPVFVAFSKADLCRTPAHPEGLWTPPLSSGGSSRVRVRIDPEKTDSLMLGYQAFPRLYKVLAENVRYFKFDFLQVIHDETPNPSPAAAPLIGRGGVPDIRGVAPALEFLTDHAWKRFTKGTREAVEWDQRVRRDRWNRDAMLEALGKVEPYTPAPPVFDASEPLLPPRPATEPPTPTPAPAPEAGERFEPRLMVTPLRGEIAVSKVVGLPPAEESVEPVTEKSEGPADRTAPAAKGEGTSGNDDYGKLL